MSECLELDNEKIQSKYFNINPKSLDYKYVGKKDEHRFGVELKENRQFHHTKTDEDGVRLGCYGHEQDGKKYSTHYVADAKGYRTVPHQELILVYPKDGTEPRKASFVESFNEEEIRSVNIRYFFPEGCQAPKIEFGSLDQRSFFPGKEPSTASRHSVPASRGSGVDTVSALLLSKTSATPKVSEPTKSLESSGRSNVLPVGTTQLQKLQPAKPATFKKSGLPEKSIIGKALHGQGEGFSGSAGSLNLPEDSSQSRTPKKLELTDEIEGRSLIGSLESGDINQENPENEQRKIFLGSEKQKDLSKTSQDRINPEAESARLLVEPETRSTVHITDDSKKDLVSEGELTTVTDILTVSSKSGSFNGPDNVYLPVGISLPQSKTVSSKQLSLPKALQKPVVKTDQLKNNLNAEKLPRLDQNCSSKCGDAAKSEIIISHPTTKSCCPGQIKIVLPIETETLDNIPKSEIDKISEVKNTVQKLKLLVELAEKYSL